jgi:MFS family permease
MAIATTLMGILPGVASWGYLSSFIFIILRLVQGVAIGGKIPGAITYVQEHIAHKPGLACGVIFLFIHLGIVLGDIARAVLTHVTSIDYAWRIAFVIGGVLAIISYFLRKELSESPEFEKISEKHPVPLFSLFKLHPSNLVASTLIVAAQAMLVSVFFLYTVTCMKIAGNISAQDISYYTLTNVTIFSLACALFGWISDYFSKKHLLIIAITLLGCCPFLFCYSIINNYYIMPSYVLCSLLGGMYAGIFSIFHARQI